MPCDGGKLRVGFVASCLVAASLCSCFRTPSRNAPMSTAGESRVTEDVIYGHKFGLAMVFNVFRAREPNGLGVIFINSGGWQSPFEGFVTDDGDGQRLMIRAELDRLSPLWGEFSPQPLLDRGYTVFEVRHGSSPLFVIPEIVADLRSRCSIHQGPRIRVSCRSREARTLGW